MKFNEYSPSLRYGPSAFVGAPMPMLHVADVIDEAALRAGAKAEPGEAAPKCSFRIAGGTPGARVSWRVEAVRNDRWVQQRGAPVEVEKQDPERGTYQHPELYDQPPAKGMQPIPGHPANRTRYTPICDTPKCCANSMSRPMPTISGRNPPVSPRPLFERRADHQPWLNRLPPNCRYARSLAVRSIGATTAFVWISSSSTSQESGGCNHRDLV